MSQITVHSLSNGLTLIAYHMPHVRATSLCLKSGPGAIHEPSNLLGLSSVLSTMYCRGTARMATREFLEFLERCGISLRVSAGLFCIDFDLTAEPSNLGSMLEILGQVIREPILPAEQLAPVVRSHLINLASINDSPQGLVMHQVRRRYFSGKFKRSVVGTKEGLEAIKLEDLRAFAQLVRAEGSVLVVAGAFELRGLIDLCEQNLRFWPGDALARADATITGISQSFHIPRDTKQVHFALMYPFAPLSDPDYFACRLAVEILSGSMAGRLSREVREKRGLVYSIGAVHRTINGAGYLIMSGGSSAPNAREALDVSFAEIGSMFDGSGSAYVEEVCSARECLGTKLATDYDMPVKVANGLAAAYLINGQIRSAEDINRGLRHVGLEDFQRARLRFPLHNVTLVSAGPVALTLPGIESATTIESVTPSGESA